MNEVINTLTKLGVRTEVFSNKYLIIDGCDSVIDAKKEFVIVKSGRMKIEIKGKSLKVSSLTERSLCLNGSIHSVNFKY